MNAFLVWLGCLAAWLAENFIVPVLLVLAAIVVIAVLTS